MLNNGAFANKSNISYKQLPGSCHENVISEGWVYYAPGYAWGADVCVPVTNRGIVYNKKLTRRNIVTADIEMLDISKIDQPTDGIIGIDKDDKGNVYLISASGVLLQIKVNNHRFQNSLVNTLKLPLNSGFYVNVLYHNGYVYVAPMAHSLFVRVDCENFSQSGMEVVDLSATDPGATGFNGLCADPKGFIWAAPNWNGKRWTGKILRVDSNDFTSKGVNIIDLESLDSNARGYHGICCSKNSIVLSPHRNENGMHSNLAIIDINRPSLDGVAILNVSKNNSQIGGMIGCVSVNDAVWLFPAEAKNNSQNKSGYGIVTILNPMKKELKYLSLNNIFPEVIISPYDGSFDGKSIFFSPYKSYINGVEYFDSRAIKIDI